MKNIGYINASKKETGEQYRGRIDTLPFSEAIMLKKAVKRSASEKAPDYDIYVERMQGNIVHVGAAWKKKGPNRYYLSLHIDDPSLPEALNLMGFKQDGRDSYDLVWKRQS